jgi:hypothetical protein
MALRRVAADEQLVETNTLLDDVNARSSRTIPFASASAHSA